MNSLADLTVPLKARNLLLRHVQSQPTKALKNTCVGISTTEVFGNLVRVLKTGKGDHLQLDFGDREESVREWLVKDEFYG
jgi:hypothetical protein